MKKFTFYDPIMLFYAAIINIQVLTDFEHSKPKGFAVTDSH